MSSSLRIPERDRSALAKLAALPIALVDMLAQALEREPPTLSYEDLEARVSERVTDIPNSDVQSIVDLLMTLYSVKNAFDAPTAEFVTEIAESESLDFSREVRDRLRDYLKQLLSIESLIITSKASDVLLTNENNFHGARIVSEVRYLFGDNVESLPTAAVINHVLKITCHEDSKLTDIYIGLDTVDLANLKAVIERAQQKGDTLRSMMANAGIKVIDRIGG